MTVPADPWDSVDIRVLTDSERLILILDRIESLAVSFAAIGLDLTPDERSLIADVRKAQARQG